MNTIQYLAACKQKLNITSDYALSKALGVKRQAVGKWQAGQQIPTNWAAFRIAEILGEQPAGVIADLERERAERDGAEPEEADQWKEWARRLGGAAATILVALGMGTLPNADNNLRQSSASTDIYIVSSAKKRRRRKRDEPGPMFAGLLAT